VAQAVVVIVIRATTPLTFLVKAAMAGQEGLAPQAQLLGRLFTTAVVAVAVALGHQELRLALL
jgi:hypothetical protein